MAARQVADALGICFHVGSQAMSPQAYSDALARVRAAIVAAAVTVDVIDVGGGFPSAYPGMEPPPLERYFRTIHEAFESLPCQLFGRTVVRAGPRAVGRICLAAGPRRAAPRRRALHQRRRLWRAVRCRAYRLALPGRARCASRTATPATSASASTARPATTWITWPARSMLPADTNAGDFIEIGMLGAYGCAMRTAFNGFTSDETVIVDRRADGEPLRRAREPAQVGRTRRQAVSKHQLISPSSRAGGIRGLRLARVQQASASRDARPFAGERRA